MIQKLFLNYTLSLEMKEIGFEEPCLGWWQLVGEGTPHLNIEPSSSDWMNKEWTKIFLAPLYQQTIDFLREKHGIHIQILINDNDNYFCELVSTHKRDLFHSPHSSFPDYYSALTQAIKEAINIVKNKTK